MHDTSRYDHQLHFYNLAASQSQPRMLIVDDIEDAFIPMPQDLLVNLEECMDNVKQLLEQLPVLFKNATSGQVNESSSTLLLSLFFCLGFLSLLKLDQALLDYEASIGHLIVKCNRRQSG